MTRIAAVVYARDGRGWRATVRGMVGNSRVTAECWDESKAALRQWVELTLACFGMRLGSEKEEAA